VKAVARALHRVNGTPLLRRQNDLLPPRKTPSFINGNSPLSNRKWTAAASSKAAEETTSLRASPAPIGKAAVSKGPSSAIPIKRSERQALTEASEQEAYYGSFVSTPPPQSPSPAVEFARNVFELPGPAIRVPSNISDQLPMPNNALKSSLSRLAVQRSASASAAVPTAGQRVAEASPDAKSAPLKRPPTHFRRFLSMSHASPRHRTKSGGGYDLQPMDEVQERERQFFDFLDGELDKVETFYRLKEAQAGARLELLKEQLHEMRDRRTAEIQEVRRKRAAQKHEGNGATDEQHPSRSWVAPIKTRLFKPGPNSKSLQKMPETPHIPGYSGNNERRDYVRKHHEHEVPYRTAKRKLKLAMQEFYRGLDLLKSYAMLNRKAFRKLNKKYDKAVNARPPYRYMTERVNKAWFVNSDVLDGYIHAVEDMYARYFERGNHKIAAGKLRNLTKRPGDESASAFGNGLLIGIGAVLAVQGLVRGSEMLFVPDPIQQQRASYLLQLYGGYFLMLYLLILFCIDCRIWTQSKINYPFIFEFDPRSHLDWRQLAAFPSFFFAIFGLFLWLNFSGLGDPRMYLYFPVILVGITFIILFLPLPVIWHRSRLWFLSSHVSISKLIGAFPLLTIRQGRLLLAGLYPVEFRDFFLGDMYCSLTYATCVSWPCLMREHQGWFC
jgi:xenotropic and polytropic retrovirus receptor 1